MIKSEIKKIRGSKQRGRNGTSATVNSLFDNVVMKYIYDARMRRWDNENGKQEFHFLVYMTSRNLISFA